MLRNAGRYATFAKVVLVECVVLKKLLLSLVVLAACLLAGVPNASAIVLSYTNPAGEVITIDTSEIAQLIASGMNPVEIFAVLSAVNIDALDAEQMASLYLGLQELAQAAPEFSAQLAVIADQVATAYAEKAGATAQDLPVFASPT